MELVRDAYKSLLAWKNMPNHVTLEVSGARQVGKTFLVNKFADCEYKQKIYVNMLDLSGEIFMYHYDCVIDAMKHGTNFENPVYEIIKRFYPAFVDSRETVVIVDEIQESAKVYNRIREFTRNLKSDFIITGSYLGRILDQEFKYSAGDITSIEITTLTFEEFLQAFNKRSLLNSLDLFGNSADDAYGELSELYNVYCKIGGYPAVVLQYLDGASIDDCYNTLMSIVQLFLNESQRYFHDILDYTTYTNLLYGVTRLLVREKKGLGADSLSEELQKIITYDYSSNVNKASVNRAISWLHSSGIIGFAGKVVECNFLDFRNNARCYFMDLGLASYFLQQIGSTDDEIAGMINENFVYLNLKRRTGWNGELALEMPAFATFRNGELDFFVKPKRSDKTWGIEVKAGKNSCKTARNALESGKIDYLLMAKGNTKGGMFEKTYTIPIYAISRFDFSANPLGSMDLF